MGMFDTLKVEMKIPGYSEVPTDQFQTKDFDCLLHNYVITVNGQLYREEWDYKWIDDENAFLGGYSEKIEESYRRVYLTDYHGDVIFYTSTPMTIDRIWRDYTARFTNGRVERIWYEDKQY